MSDTPKFVEKFNATFRDRLHAVIDELNLDVDRDPFTKLLANCIASKEYADEVKRELAAERERADRLIAFLADDALAMTYQSLAQFLGIYPEGTEITYRAHLDMRTADGSCVPWVASQTDILADDWQVVP